MHDFTSKTTGLFYSNYLIYLENNDRKIKEIFFILIRWVQED